VVAEAHARKRLDLDVAQRRLLVLRELADLRLREPDVGDGLRRNLGEDGVDLTLAELLRRPFVEFFRVLADGGVAALPHVVEDVLDSLAHLAVELVGHFLGNASLEMSSHGHSLLDL
jgi:hypothetical protein